jgi:hypothetical protein
VTRTLEDSREVEAILRRMEQIRRGLDEDAQDIVEGARDLGNWRYYVKTYPWICLGAAMVGGYLIVPRRRAIRRLIPLKYDKVGTNGEPPSPGNSAPAGRKTSSVGGTLLAFVGSLVLRTAISHAVRRIDNLYTSHANGAQRKEVTHESSIGRAKSSRR